MAIAETLLSPPAGLLGWFAAATGGAPADVPEAARAFVLQAQDDWAEDELPGISEADVGAALAEFWAFGEARDGTTEPAVRIRRAPGTA
jgi:hypothetical protein